jgi:hypothetical protein
VLVARPTHAKHETVLKEREKIRKEVANFLNILRANSLYSLIVPANQTLMHRTQSIRCLYEMLDLQIYEPSLYDRYGNASNGTSLRQKWVNFSRESKVWKTPQPWQVEGDF